MNLLIHSGTIVNSDKTEVSDILIKKGKIAHVGKNLPVIENTKVIEAKGKLVFPGGVDPHVHMHLKTPSGYSSDDFYSGSLGALHGGTTTIVDFVTPDRGQSLTDSLYKRENEAARARCHWSLHVSPVEWRSSTEDEINECIKEGYGSFKVYMAYKNTIGLDDADIFKVMKVVGKAGGIVLAHCEEGDKIEALQKKYFNNNNSEPLYHPLSRPARTEANAVKKTIALAAKAKCPLYIVHVSSKESLRYIREAKNKGIEVFAETCPQYLLFDDSVYEGTFEETAKFVMSPPLRKKQDNEELWKAISDGTISTIGTDHCPFNFKQKLNGVNDFRRIPNGAGGVEHRLSLLYTYGILKDKFSINKMVEVFSANPAKIFGMYPSKGCIKAGSDADLVIWNPGTRDVISAKNHHQKCDLNIYEGLEIMGSAEYVILDGKIIIEKGKMK